MTSKVESEFDDVLSKHFPIATGPEGVVYVCPPIDHWRGWSEPEALMHEEMHDRYGCPWEVAEAVVTARRRLRQHAGYRADRALQPRMSVAPLPYPHTADCLWLVAHKSGDNGTTYVWSPLPLPWLEEWRVSEPAP